jgi:glycosyltransferase involved in cell wall biosynthesis
MGNTNKSLELRTVVQVLQGSENYGVATVIRQIEAGFPALKYVFLNGGPFVKEISPSKILWVGESSRSVSAGKSTLLGLLAVVFALPVWYRSAGRIVKALPDTNLLLHCHCLYMLLVAFLIKLQSSRSHKIIFHFHSTMNTNRLYGLLAILERFVVGRMADGLIAVSKAVAGYWAGIRAPVWVIYNGTEVYLPKERPERLIKRDGVRDIIIAGSLCRDKGHLVAVESMRLLQNEAPEKFHLWIAGGPLDEVINPFARELRDAITRHKLGGQVTLLGHIPNLREYIPYVWIALQQRISPEPFGLWVLECLSAGVPVIASNTGAMSELIRDGEEGLLVPPDSPRAVADSILSIYRQSLREPMSIHAVSRAKCFSKENFLQGLSSVYAQFSSSRGGVMEVESML